MDVLFKSGKIRITYINISLNDATDISWAEPVPFPSSAVVESLVQLEKNMFSSTHYWLLAKTTTENNINDRKPWVVSEWKSTVSK